MFCKNCGKEIDDNAYVCIHCGVKIKDENTFSKTEANGMAVAGFVCSFFIPLLGWIFGGVGLSRSNKCNGKGRSLSIASLVISSILFFLNLILLF